MLENYNRYQGTYISIRLELHALLFYILRTNCFVSCSSLLRVSPVFLSSTMPPCPSKCHNYPVSLDPKSLSDFDRAQRSPKEFPHSSSLSTKSRDYWHEEAFGPACLRAQMCKHPLNTGHWSLPPSSTNVKWES